MQNEPSLNSRAVHRRDHLSRRRFLRGVGACVALPAFASLLGSTSALAEIAASATTGTAGSPLRMAFVYFPNGAIQPNWWPTGDGKAFELGRTMQPLKDLRDSVQIFGGLDHRNATPGEWPYISIASDFMGADRSLMACLAGEAFEKGM